MDNQAETPVATPVVVPMVTLTVEVPKELNDLRVALVSLTKSVKEAQADGFQLMTDVPAIVLENLKTLGQAIDNISFVKIEVKEKLAESINCMALTGTEILVEVTK